MSTMKDLARIVADRHDMEVQESEIFVSAMFEEIMNALTSDEQVKVKGLGTFKVQTVRERASININTGEKVIINSHEKISFSPDTSMRNSVNKPFAHFETVPLNEGVIFDDIIEEQEATSDLSSLNNDSTTSIISPAENDSIDNSIVTSLNTDDVNKDTEELTVEAPNDEYQYHEDDNKDDNLTGINDTDNDSLELDDKDITQEAETTEASTSILTNTETEIQEEQEIEIEDTDETQHATMTFDNKNNITEEMTELQDHNNNPSGNGNNMSTTSSILLGLLLLVVGFVIGRATADISFDDVKGIFTQNDNTTTEDVIVEEIKVQADSIKDDVKKDTVSTKETKDGTTVTNKDNQQAEAETATEETANTTKAEEKSTAKAEKQPDNNFSAGKYDSDPRIRTGAYEIVGIRETITVQKGQTFASISKAHLGPGMECYLEALNGKIEVKVGQNIKIPELKLKKKAKK